MNRRFRGAGTFAQIDGQWVEVFPFAASRDDHVTVMMADASAWRPTGELSRRRRSGRQLIDVSLAGVEKIVDVSLYGRHDGVAVYPLGPVRDGHVLVGPEHDDPQLAREQGYEGDGRFSEFRKRVPVEEFVDAVEEITVLYRRGVPPL